MKDEAGRAVTGAPGEIGRIRIRGGTEVTGIQLGVTLSVMGNHWRVLSRGDTGYNLCFTKYILAHI